MEEIWKFINGMSEYYMVSSNGRILSFRRNRMVMMKQTPTAKGYLTIELYSNFSSKQFYVHRLVAEHFVSNPHNLPQVNHKDMDKKNNRVNNLEWCSIEDNLYHAHDNRAYN